MSDLLIQCIGDVTVVSFVDTSILDQVHIQRIAEPLYHLVDAQDRRKLILDFSSVKLLSSQMMGVLLTLNKKMKAIKGKMVFCGLKPDLQKLFQVTGLEKLFEFYPDEPEAMDAFN